MIFGSSTVLWVPAAVVCLMGVYLIRKHYRSYLRRQRRYKRMLAEQVETDLEYLMRNSGHSLAGNLVKEYNGVNIVDSYLFQEVLLGRGSSAHVVIGVQKKTKRRYAIKVVDASARDVAWKYDKEVNILRDLDHVNIVRIHEMYHKPKALYLVLELCTGGHLGHVLNICGGQLKEEQTLGYIQQLCKAVAHCHNRGICHRDIKLQNVLLESSGRDAQIKLVDFGNAVRFTPATLPMQKIVGTTYTTAPEVFKQEYDQRCDVWSIGVVTYILLSGRRPFDSVNIPEPRARESSVIANILMGNYNFLSESWESVSEPAIHFVKCCLDTNYRSRRDAVDLLEHQWMDSAEGGLRNMELAEIFESRESNVRALYVRKLNKILSRNQNDSNSGLRRTTMIAVAFLMPTGRLLQLRGLFQMLDRDGKGCVSREEFAHAVYTLNPEVLPAEVDRVFASMDQNSDGNISFTEFVAATLDPGDVDISELNQAFRLLDKDSKGFLTSEDLKRVMLTYMKDPNAGDYFPETQDRSRAYQMQQQRRLQELQKRIDKIFEETDMDKDGFISYTEFLYAMASSKRLSAVANSKGIISGSNRVDAARAKTSLFSAKGNSLLAIKYEYEATAMHADSAPLHRYSDAPSRTPILTTVLSNSSSSSSTNTNTNVNTSASTSNSKKAVAGDSTDTEVAIIASATAGSATMATTATMKVELEEAVPRHRRQSDSSVKPSNAFALRKSSMVFTQKQALIPHTTPEDRDSVVEGVQQTTPSMDAIAAHGINKAQELGTDKPEGGLSKSSQLSQQRSKVDNSGQDQGQGQSPSKKGSPKSRRNSTLNKSDVTGLVPDNERKNRRYANEVPSIAHMVWEDINSSVSSWALWLTCQKKQDHQILGDQGNLKKADYGSGKKDSKRRQSRRGSSVGIKVGRRGSVKGAKAQIHAQQQQQERERDQREHSDNSKQSNGETEAVLAYGQMNQPSEYVEDSVSYSDTDSDSEDEHFARLSMRRVSSPGLMWQSFKRKASIVILGTAPPPGPNSQSNLSGQNPQNPQNPNIGGTQSTPNPRSSFIRTKEMLAALGTFDSKNSKNVGGQGQNGSKLRHSGASDNSSSTAEAGRDGAGGGRYEASSSSPLSSGKLNNNQSPPTSSKSNKNKIAIDGYNSSKDRGAIGPSSLDQQAGSTGSNGGVVSVADMLAASSYDYDDLEDEDEGDNDSAPSANGNSNSNIARYNSSPSPDKHKDGSGKDDADSPNVSSKTHQRAGRAGGGSMISLASQASQASGVSHASQESNNSNDTSPEAIGRMVEEIMRQNKSKSKKGSHKENKQSKPSNSNSNTRESSFKRERGEDEDGDDNGLGGGFLSDAQDTENEEMAGKVVPPHLRQSLGLGFGPNSTIEYEYEQVQTQANGNAMNKNSSERERQPDPLLSESEGGKEPEDSTTTDKSQDPVDKELQRENSSSSEPGVVTLFDEREGDNDDHDPNVPPKRESSFTKPTNQAHAINQGQGGQADWSKTSDITRDRSRDHNDFSDSLLDSSTLSEMSDKLTELVSILKGLESEGVKQELTPEKVQQLADSLVDTSVKLQGRLSVEERDNRSYEEQEISANGRDSGEGIAGVVGVGTGAAAVHDRGDRGDAGLKTIHEGLNELSGPNVSKHASALISTIYGAFKAGMRATKKTNKVHSNNHSNGNASDADASDGDDSLDAMEEGELKKKKSSKFNSKRRSSHS